MALVRESFSMSSNRNSLVWGLVLCYLAAVDCFLPLPLQTRIRVEASRRDVVLDPSALDPNVVDVTIAVVSAAAGAATQVPRIQQLEKDLEGARADLLEVSAASGLGFRFSLELVCVGAYHLVVL